MENWTTRNLHIEYDELERSEKFQLMIKHIHVNIEGELGRISRGVGTVVGSGSNISVWNLLIKAQAEGKEFRSGCDNMKEDGSCGGHEV